MFGKHFQLNDETLKIIEQFGSQMPGGFFIYRADAGEQLLYANRAVIKIFGCDSLEDFKQLTSYTFRGMLHPDDYDRISASIVNQIDAGGDQKDYVEYRIIRKDGAVRWVDDYGHYTETEAYGGIYYVFISDITEKKAETESRLRQQEMEKQLALQAQLLREQEESARQSQMITAMASDYRCVYYVTLDTDEGICYRTDHSFENALSVGERFRFHETFAAYAERFVAEPYRADFLQFIDPEAIRSRLSEELMISFRYLRIRDGIESYEMLRMAGVRRPEDRGDHIVHAVGVGFTDIDREMRESMARNEALRVALDVAEEASRAKTAFLSNMSHEIRTPMNAIIGLNSIAMSDPEIGEKAKEYLNRIGASARHLLSIINDILDMSRIESGRMIIRHEEFSFSRALEQVNTMIAGQCRDKGLHYKCRLAGKIDDWFIGDDMKLRQVMINILGNAVKFTPAGGTVTFTIEETARFRNKVTLRFTVSDTGIGMSPEFLPKIFDTFSQEDSSSTSRYGSTGLGMPITKSIVELMNGTIDVRSEKGVGTTFTVTVTLDESDRQAESAEEGDLQPHEIHVLAIDDDPVACEHARVVLSQVGIGCDTACSGEEALEMIKMRHARRDDYNLILVDWRMPGMNGVETSRRIREIVGSEAAIIILTSYNWDDVEEEARAAGVDTFVPKPLFAGNVMNEFREAFRRKNRALLASVADLKGRRILLAEDVPVNAEIMMMVLSAREMEVDHAENGRIAVDLFASHPENYYDAVLMDMRMPEMDGLEATRTIRAMDRADAKTVPIIALTANAFDEDVHRSMQAGLNAHLSKPVEPDTLYRTLESLIG